MAERDYYTIGQVVEMLSPEHPDLTVSSLRFLEQEGLVSPERTEGGHRRYSTADIERLRFIKEMQRRFFPLNAIRELLLKANHKKEKGEMIFFRPLHYDPDFAPLSRVELARASGLEEAQLAEMESAGMVGPSPDGKYDEDDLHAARTMKGLVDQGLEPADLAFYMSHIEPVVEGELRLMIGKIMANRSIHGMETVALRVEELGDELWRLLHAKTLRKRARRLVDELRQQFGQGG